jgi:hypothetical protein
VDFVFVRRPSGRNAASAAPDTVEMVSIEDQPAYVLDEGFGGGF